MDSLHRLDTPGEATPNEWAAWRALPRLLVSRQWRWVTLGVIAIILVLLRLGFWQLDRLGQRRAINAQITSHLDQPPIQLTGQMLDPVAEEYRQIVVTGTYDHSGEIVLRNRARDGVPGMDLLTPLRIANSEQSVLIDRGWLPLSETAPEQRARFAVAGPVTIRGILKPPRSQSSWGPQDRQPAGGRLDAWFFVDTDRIGKQVGYPLLPFYIEQLPGENAPPLPHPQPNTKLNEGPHLSYAVQWFSFAAILVGGYAAFVVTRSKEQRGKKPAT